MNYNNKIPKTSRSFAYNPKGKILEIFKRISEDESKLNPTLIKLKEKNRQSYILNLNNYNESDLNEVKDSMNNHEKKLLSQINEFKKGTIEFEQNKKNNFNDFQKIKNENLYFSSMYKRLKKNSQKRGENELMKNEYFFKIANTYLLKNERLPDLNRNVFNTNPLILDNDHIKTYFINNKNVDSKKFLNYLDRIKLILTRKILGSHSISPEEKRHIDEIIRKEKPKGYIPPQVLIPSLQEEISKSQFTYDCLINEYNNKNYNTPNNSHISSYNNNSSSINNISNNSVFPMKKKKYDIKQLIIKKSQILNSSKINKYKDSINVNLNNNSSLDTTTVPIETKKNDINNINNINNNILVNSNSMKNIMSSVKGIFNRKNNHTMIIATPLRQKLKSNTARVIKFFNRDLDLSNLNKNNYDFNSNEQIKEIKNNLLKKSFNSNIKSKIDNSFIMDKEMNNLSMIQNNKLELFTPKKKIDFFNIINENVKEKENKKEKNRHSSLKNLNEIFQQSPKNMSEDFRNISKNDDQTPGKLDLSLKNDHEQNSMPIIIEKSVKPKHNSDLGKSQDINVEELYNKSLNLKSLEDEVELENYLISSRGKKNLKDIITLKNTYFNIRKMERNFYKNLIKDEFTFRIRRGIQGRFLNENQTKILNKNDKFIATFLRNANLFRKVICERNKDF